MATSSHKKKQIHHIEHPVPKPVIVPESGLGVYLRNLRLKAGFTQAEVAEELGFSTYQFIYNMEKEKCLPPTNHIPKIAKLYKESEKNIQQMIVRHITERAKRKYGTSK